jgi:diacylglycerol kinase
MADEQTPGEKQDVIDRKAAWIERAFDKLFAAVQQNVFATLLVLAVGVIFWQQGTINKLNELRIADITTLNEKINAAVEKRVDDKLTEKLAPYEAKQDSISKNVDTSLYNLNGTVETVKQYIKKKTR